MAELACGEPPVKAERMATAQNIPLKFLENILLDMKHSGLVESQRGGDGGYWLSRPPADITLADIIRAVEGPLAYVRGQRPESLDFSGPAEPLRDVWVALRASVRTVLESVTLEHLAAGELPALVMELIADQEAWHSR
jgi:Rrf2 family protein